MVISKRNKILFFLFTSIIVIYCGAIHYTKAENERDYHIAKTKCQNALVEGLDIRFKNFMRKEIDQGFVLTIIDSLGHLYYKKDEKFFTVRRLGEKDYTAFDLKRNFKQSDTIKIYTANKTFLLTDFLVGPSMVKAYTIPFFGDGMRPFGCQLKTLNINGVSSNTFNTNNSVIITE